MTLFEHLTFVFMAGTVLALLAVAWKLQMLREDFEQRLRDARESFSGDYQRLSEKYYELQRRQYSGFKALGLVYEAPSRTEGHWRVQREKEIG